MTQSIGRDLRGGQQPSQTMSLTKKKYSKVVRSHPMDLQKVVQPNDPLDAMKHEGQSQGMSYNHSMTGAKLVT